MESHNIYIYITAQYNYYLEKSAATTTVIFVIVIGLYSQISLEAIITFLQYL